MCDVIRFGFSEMFTIWRKSWLQQIENGLLEVQKRNALYPDILPGSKYDSVPEYAKRIFKVEPDLSPEAEEYIRYGKATSIALFKSSFPKYRRVHLTNKTPRIFRHPLVFDTKFNGNITIHHINKYAYLKAIPKYLYIISAILKDVTSTQRHNPNNSRSSKPKNWFKAEDAAVRKVPTQEVVLTGWIQEQLSNATVLCCFLLSGNSSVVLYNNMKRLIWTQVMKQELLASKVFCPVPPDIGRTDVIGAALSLPTDRCRKESFMNIESIRPKIENSIGICAKILYGDFKADRLVEWLEIQRHIEVDKVLLYVYNLDYKTVEVVKHYTLEGFVEMIPFDYPMAAEFERYVGEKKAMAFIDEQVVVFDCMERLRGYTYAAIMDVDEILYAKAIKYHGLKALMTKLWTQYPKAGGFTFKTEIFITDWPTNNQSDSHLFWHTKHQNRTRPLIDRPKNLIKLDRVVLGSVWTHNFTTKAGFKKYVVPPNVALIKHYRPCRENWGCYKRQGYIDKSIVRIAKTIKDKIFNKFRQLQVRRGGRFKQQNGTSGADTAA